MLNFVPEYSKVSKDLFHFVPELILDKKEVEVNTVLMGYIYGKMLATELYKRKYLSTLLTSLKPTLDSYPLQDAYTPDANLIALKSEGYKILWVVGSTYYSQNECCRMYLPPILEKFHSFEGLEL
jgi:hypothetical protein